MYYKALKNFHLYIAETDKFHENCWPIELMHKYQYMNYHIQLTDPNIFDKIHSFLNEWTNNKSNINVEKNVIISEDEIIKKIESKKNEYFNESGKLSNSYFNRSNILID